MPHIDDEFDRLIKRLTSEFGKSPQRDMAAQRLREAQEWARKLGEIE